MSLFRHLASAASYSPTIRYLYGLPIWSPQTDLTISEPFQILRSPYLTIASVEEPSGSSQIWFEAAFCFASPLQKQQSITSQEGWRDNTSKRLKHCGTSDDEAHDTFALAS